MGFRSSGSTKLIIARDNPAFAASRVVDIDSGVTHQEVGRLPPESGYGHGERVIRISRKTLVSVRSDIQEVL